jgi:gluconate 5-dehydrogenase
MAMGVDVSKYDQVTAMFNHLEKTWGRLDILVNNAGITTVRPILHEMDVMNWQKVIDVDLHGVFYCMKEGLRMMIKQNKGSIINITSIAGLRHAHGTGDGSELGTNIAYVTAKTAIVGLTKRAAAEYGPYGIRVNGIAPGQFAWTRLPESRGVNPLSEEERRKAREGLVVTSGIPLKRTGKPEEIRSLLLYLASDASSYITGQIIADDGGATCL